MFILYFLAIYFLIKFAVYYVNNKTSNDFDPAIKKIKDISANIKSKLSKH